MSNFLFALIFSLVPALVYGGVSWLVLHDLTATAFIGLGIFLFGLDVCLRGRRDDE